MADGAGALFSLSAQQKLIWLHQQSEAPGNSVCVVRLSGPLDAEKLRSALNGVVSRQELLRMVFRAQAGMKVPFQTVLASGAVSWEDARRESEDPDALMQAEQSRAFDLENGPLVHVRLMHSGESGALLVLTLPSLLADADSLSILTRELAAAYNGEPLDTGVETLRYLQFTQWQNDLLETQDEHSGQAREFWAQAAAVPSEIALPEERPAGPRLPFGFVSFFLANQTTEPVLLAAWQALIWRLTGESRFSIRVCAGGRQFEELENTPGPIAKYLPIPARFDGEFRFSETARQAAESLSAALEWQEYFPPGEGNRHGNCIAFEYASASAPHRAGDLEFQAIDRDTRIERFKVRLSIQESTGTLRCRLHYDANRLSQAAVEHFAGYYRTLLASAMADPETLVAHLPLLDPPSLHRTLVEWNRTEAEYPRHLCFPQLFEAQAVKTPERLAVQSGAIALTYRELNERANRIARHLRKLGVGPDSLVALCLEPSVDTITGLLAIMKAGGAYVPLNVDNPKARLASQLLDVTALVTHSAIHTVLPEFTGGTLLVDREDPWLGEDAGNPAALAQPEHLAYVLYTSGSTGTPKGVCIRHRNLVNYASDICGRLALEDEPDGLYFATVSTISADLGNTCIFPALISGGCVRVIPREIASDGAAFGIYAARYPIDVLKIVPSHLEALLEGPDGVKTIPRKHLIIGGEPLTTRLIAKIHAAGAACRILNHYGPTETTIGSLTYPVAGLPDGAQAVPIGRPIANTQAYILDSHLQPVPPGVRGELYLSGDGVSAGYLNRGELTQERFLPNPFVPERTMYRTGDIARYLPNGNIEFLGRADNQVKIRGFRIELGEIEAALLSHPGVRQALVLAKPDPRGDKRLVAYTVLHREKSAKPEDIRAHLALQVPTYMVPALVVLPKLPLTANGKVDLQNLPEPEQVNLWQKEYIAPRNQTETAVERIWAEVFRRDGIGVEDNFFDIGGHSLMATQVISRVRARFSVAIDIGVVFERPTIAGQAEAIQVARESQVFAAESPIVPVAREQYRAR